LSSEHLLFSLVLGGLDCMTLIAERLKVIDVQRGSALVDGYDVVDHLGRSGSSVPKALLAERGLLQLELSAVLATDDSGRISYCGAGIPRRASFRVSTDASGAS